MLHAPLAAVTRGGHLESLHYGALAVADADGRLLFSLGEPEQPVFPRSALKPFQALPLVESGAAAAFGLDERHLALACASHRAEPAQLAILGDWLGRLGLAETALACGPDQPPDPLLRDERVRAGLGPTRLAHNCSGKHLGLLTWRRHVGGSLEDYHRPEHPAQQALAAVFADALGGPIAPADFGSDGCNLPTPRLPLQRFAVGLARFALRRADNGVRADAMARLLAAMRARPDLVAGAGLNTEAVCMATEGRVLAKIGAEGVLAAWLPEPGLGIVIKTADGASRARFAVLAALLDRLNLVDAAARARLAPLFRPHLRNSAGEIVGAIEPCLPL